MPAKNSVKEYIPDGYYHLYNRGVEKRIIFQDEQDYHVFLSYLKTYLLPKDIEALEKVLVDESSTRKMKDQALKQLRLNNFSDSIELLAYCLMPNHFHFLVHQKDANAIDLFMNSLCTRYVMYFNRKYKRVGTLFQGVYKAVSVETEEQLLYLTRYIHRNPVDLLVQGEALHSYRYFSYLDYLQLKPNDWVKPSVVMDNFSKTNRFLSYQSFIEEEDNTEMEAHILSNVAVDAL